MSSLWQFFTMHYKPLIIITFFLFATPGFSETNSNDIGKFSSSGLQGWESKSFAGNTDYELIPSDQVQVLQATSSNNASGLFYKKRIDLQQTPYLNWRWKISSRILNNDEQTKGGDDYSARIYVVVDGGLFPWKSKALNYVWSGQTETETVWSNAFLPKNAKMLAARTAHDPLNTWLTEKRNVREDLLKVYGKDITHIDVVALMTDTDNTGQQVTAYYGDIYFTAE